MQPKDKIIASTERVTSCIKELWESIQGPGRQHCVPLAENISQSVNNLTMALPSVSNYAHSKNY